MLSSKMSKVPTGHYEEVCDLDQARAAAQNEHESTFVKSLKTYPVAIGWSALLSTAIIMEGYDTKLIGSLKTQPAFMRRYGE